MAKQIGRQVQVGIGIEATPGTPVVATIFPRWTSLTFQPISEKSKLNVARGSRQSFSDSYIRRKYSSGSLEGVLDVEVAAYLLQLVMGKAPTTATASGETVVYEHTFDPLDDNAELLTATLILKRGGVVTERFANCVLNSLTISISDDYATFTAEFLGDFPDTTTLTPSYTEETEFAYKDASVKFGTSISNADGQSATPLKSFELSINNNVQEDEAFLFGSNEPQTWIAGNREITGSYSLHFENTTETAKYQNNTKNAAILSLVGAAIGVAEDEEIRVELGALVLEEAPIENDIDGVVILNQGFGVELTATDGDISAIVTNENDGSDYAS